MGALHAEPDTQANGPATVTKLAKNVTHIHRIERSNGWIAPRLQRLMPMVNERPHQRGLEAKFTVQVYRSVEANHTAQAYRTVDAYRTREMFGRKCATSIPAAARLTTKTPLWNWQQDSTRLKVFFKRGGNVSALRFCRTCWEIICIRSALFCSETRSEKVRRHHRECWKQTVNSCNPGFL